ncbi:MAG: beta-ketoacyl synthase chain length factor [Exilibacterium sp.]
MNLIKLSIESVAVAGPGLASWPQSRSVLSGSIPYTHSDLERYKPHMLPANERRRATDLIRLAFRVCEQVVDKSPVPVSQLAAVFASSGGDYQIVDQICRTLATPERAVSPTQFHNSVHNSAAGYWSIATGSQAPSVSLSAYDATFASGLLEAGMLSRVENLPTLLAVYDSKPPAPLQRKRSIDAPFGVAFLLTPEPTPGSLAQLSLKRVPDRVQEDSAHSPELEAMRLKNPAARVLPLLELLAKNESGCCRLNLPGSQHIAIDLEPAQPSAGLQASTQSC